MRFLARFELAVLVFLFTTAIVLALCSGCAGPSRAAKTWHDVSADGYVDANEQARMDDALDVDAERETTWTNVLGWAAQLLGFGVPTAGAAVLATNRIRDRQRRKRGEPTGTPA